MLLLHCQYISIVMGFSVNYHSFCVEMKKAVGGGVCETEVHRWSQTRYCEFDS